MMPAVEWHQLTLWPEEQGEEPQQIMGWELEERVSRWTHCCDLPGAWARRRQDMGIGTIVRCTECDVRWIFDHGSWSEGPHWYRLDS